jgi:hypothetical protein
LTSQHAGSQQDFEAILVTEDDGKIIVNIGFLKLALILDDSVNGVRLAKEIKS